MNSAYSSMAPTPRRRNRSARISCPLSAAKPAARPRSVVATERASLTRIASQALSTAEQALAVVFEPPGHRRWRETAVAKLDLHRRERHTQALRRHLADHRVRAVADLVGGDLHLHFAIRQHPHPCGGGTDMGRVDGGRPA